MMLVDNNKKLFARVPMVKLQTHHVNIFFLGTVHCRQDCLQFSYFILKPQVFLSDQFHVWTRPGPQWEERRGVGKSAASNWLRCWGHLSPVRDYQHRVWVLCETRSNCGTLTAKYSKIRIELKLSFSYTLHCTAQYILSTFILEIVRQSGCKTQSKTLLCLSA